MLRRSFTLVELLTTIAIVAALVTALVVYVPEFLTWTRQTADKQTLTVLNDALTRAKCEGAGVTAFTASAPIAHVINVLKTPVNWAGTTHQFLQNAFTVPARSLFAKGSGTDYQFSAYNTYINQPGGTSPQGILTHTYLTAVGSSTWTVPADWDSGKNYVESIGGGGNGNTYNSGNTGGGGGGAYSKIANLTFSPGTSVNYFVGAATQDTWFGGSNFGTSLCAAKGGTSANSTTGAPGGQASGGIGSITYSGGNGGDGGSGGNNAGGGGGGAAGPFGNGGKGGNYSSAMAGGGGGNGGGSNGSNGSGNNGGDGGNNFNGLGHGVGANYINSAATDGFNGGGGGGGNQWMANAAGGNGTEWDINHGSGGGSGGRYAPGSAKVGGLYGGGGGSVPGFNTGGAGAQGIIVISYTH